MCCAAYVLGRLCAGSPYAGPLVCARLCTERLCAGSPYMLGRLWTPAYVPGLLYAVQFMW
jgi:hypothetical protein